MAIKMRARKIPLLFVCVWMLAGCAASQPAPVPSQSPAINDNPVTWMINRSALDRLLEAGWSIKTLKQFFDNTHTYLIGHVPSGWRSEGVK